MIVAPIQMVNRFKPNDIVMLYRPSSDENKIVHLHVDTLDAAIEANDGVKAFSLAGRDGMNLKKVVCDDAVFMSMRDMEIEATNMTSSEETKPAILSGTDWIPVMVLHNNDPVNPLHARRLVWDLFGDSFRAIRRSW